MHRAGDQPGLSQSPLFTISHSCSLLPRDCSSGIFGRLGGNQSRTARGGCSCGALPECRRRQGAPIDFISFQFLTVIKKSSRAAHGSPWPPSPRPSPVDPLYSISNTVAPKRFPPIDRGCSSHKHIFQHPLPSVVVCGPWLDITERFSLVSV